VEKGGRKEKAIPKATIDGVHTVIGILPGMIIALHPLMIPRFMGSGTHLQKGKDVERV
jgi:hypothetical protein